MNRAYPTPRLMIPRYPPDRLSGILELLFPGHRVRQRIAHELLEEIRSRGRDGFPEEEWLPFVIRLLGSDELMEFYKDHEDTPRTRLLKMVAEQAETLGLVDDDGHNLFHVYKGQYSIVLKVLRQVGMVYKKNGFYFTSPHFGDVLEAIGRLWKDWRAGLAD